MDRRVIWFGLLGVALVAGCQDRPAVVYAEWVRESAQPSVAGSRYEAYARAAEQAEAAAPKYLTTVFFTPGKRDMALKQIGPALRTLSEGARRRDLGYRFEPVSPFATPKHVRGWRLLGRGLVWKVEEAVKAGDEDGAIRCAALATSLGLDLVGGGAMDASLGMAIADEARRALAPALSRMTPAQLDRLSAALTSALERMPSIETTLEHERLNMLAGVQAVQDTYRSEEWGRLAKAMGPSVRPTLDWMRKIRVERPEEATRAFQGMADEAEAEARYVRALAAAAAAKRDGIPMPTLDPDRGWRRMSPHMFGTGRPLLTQFDDTIARTRLFALEARLQRIAKLGARYPRSLGAWPKAVTTDPYSGEAFVYRADGGDCKVYSVGADLRDDGGQTDDSFTAPDLRLELR